MKKIITILLITLMLAGCAPGGIPNETIISTKSYDFYNKKLKLGKQVIVYRSGNTHSAHQKAIDDAISQNSCTVALTNVREDNNGRIEGTEVIDPTLGNCAK
ncbi:hypothetical protein BKK51_06390 [Rodentibacter trehalosifermentans]|uniref:Type IV secretion system putative lipoprotein virB7 n=1 Tax=Rodentibacter trehalosifermentans TaxID=1908263 RepID=A0A1V3IU21_9PAST|nr:membrane lipoprotein lipid attachment site-containing protein [Rodentibacter trehalosifermentans]OOF45444.1 hypothetical protein BKK51_06390 [Rodentibacter trehalosifermentans]OOF48083.1 hypothetical protein BKK52_06725 [Rodentibacter trehalosifermentans]